MFLCQLTVSLCWFTCSLSLNNFYSYWEDRTWNLMWNMHIWFIWCCVNVARLIMEGIWSRMQFSGFVWGTGAVHTTVYYLNLIILFTNINWKCVCVCVRAHVHVCDSFSCDHGAILSCFIEFSYLWHHLSFYFSEVWIWNTEGTYTVVNMSFYRNSQVIIFWTSCSIALLYLE